MKWWCAPIRLLLLLLLLALLLMSAYIDFRAISRSRKSWTSARTTNVLTHNTAASSCIFSVDFCCCCRCFWGVVCFFFFFYFIKYISCRFLALYYILCFLAALESIARSTHTHTQTLTQIHRFNRDWVQRVWEREQSEWNKKERRLKRLRYFLAAAWYSLWFGNEKFASLFVHSKN